MIGRERIKIAMECRKPDRVPVWCPLSLEHILRNGTLDGKILETIEEFIEAECRLTKFYGFDGVVLYLPGVRRGTKVYSLLNGMINKKPEGDSTHIFTEATPENWEQILPEYQPEDFYGAQLAREILGSDYHIGGWTPDGYSWAIQWFPSLEDAMIATIQDPSRFKAMVNYFDEQSIASAKAQIELGGIESIHISSPYAGSSFISPNTYKEFVLPSVKKLVEAIKPLNAFTYLHTCGFISDRLETIAESGVDGIECMDPPPLGNVELSDAKKRVGNKVFLKGNIDSVNVLLRGSDEEVKKAILKCLNDGMSGGGYILSTACSVAPLVPPERVKRLSELAEQFGKYIE
jgi:hypothetical protein